MSIPLAASRENDMQKTLPDLILALFGLITLGAKQWGKVISFYLKGILVFLIKINFKEKIVIRSEENLFSMV